MIRSALLAAGGMEGLGRLIANHELVVASGVATFPHAGDFQRLFPNAEHKVVEAEHDFGPPDYWRTVYDWLSRSRLHDRYVVMLSTAVDIRPDGTIQPLKPPHLDLFEIEEVVKGRKEKGAPKYKMQISTAEDDAWAALVAETGDEPVDLGLTNDQPVARFDTYWQDTQDGWIRGASADSSAH
jgi:hypothetical protein